MVFKSLKKLYNLSMKKIVLSLSILFSSTILASAQPTLQNDYSYSMEVPSVVGMEGSAAHLYVLSETEGMAVFRTHKDSLQWLYTASGMQRRGTSIRADIRFAYLFGKNRRLTVLEPTSVMGAYSATNLPEPPLDAVRSDENLYVALGSGGLGRLSLETPQTLDAPMQSVETDQLQEQTITDIEASSDQFYALSENHKLFIFNKNDSRIDLQETLTLENGISRIFYVDEKLLGTNEDGAIFEISARGNLAELGSIGEPVTTIKTWKDWLFIRGSSNRLWTSYQLTEPTPWKEKDDAGNYLAFSKGQLWISEYNRISRVSEVSDQPGNQSPQKPPAESTDTELEMQPIKDQIIPYPNALLIPLRLKGNYPVQNVQFSLQTSPANAKIRGQSIYWKPETSGSGEYNFRVAAAAPDGETSSAAFTVQVSPFNSPPRFTPTRTISIPVDRPFSLPIKAIDPDGTDRNLIRYLGVNLPEGASINEQTGEFSWTPGKRQVGENSFRVIATDQYGAASSADVTIRVIETNSGGQEQ
jgi:hypothetical protein